MDLPTTFLGQMAYLLTNNIDLFLEGIKNTLLLSIIGTGFGSVIGFLLAVIKTHKVDDNASAFNKIMWKVLRGIVIVYIDVIRGTPMMVQAMIFFYGVAANFLDPIPTGIIIISFNTAAYIAEIVRGAIEAIDDGQMEAARSLGLTRMQAMEKIILPQAFINSIPALMNELIVNVKDSSVLSVIGVTELFYMSKAAGSEFYWTLPAYVLGAIFYLILTMSLSKAFVYYLKRKESKAGLNFNNQSIIVE